MDAGNNAVCRRTEGFGSIVKCECCGAEIYSVWLFAYEDEKWCNKAHSEVYNWDKKLL